MGAHEFFKRLRHTFGDQFLCFLGLSYLGVKGVVLAFVSSSMLPYFQGMGVSGGHYQLATVVSRLPWSMKGWVGVLSDCLPIGRYHKRGYLLLSAVAAVGGLVTLSLLPPDAVGPSAVWCVAVLFCVVNAMIVTFDLLCEGKYSELIREEHAGSEVITLVWACVSFGGLIAAVAVGALIDTTGPRPLLAACLPMAALALWRTAAGDLPEEPARSVASLRLKVWSEPELFILAAAMAAGALVVGVSTALLSGWGGASVSLGVAGALILYSFKALPRTLARSNLYMFLMSAAYMDLSGQLDYFYTGGPSCVEDGPHFSYSYYLAISSIVGSGCAAMGAILFQYMQRLQFRTVFGLTAVLQVLASTFDLLIISRFNLAIGLSDQVTYLFGDAACQSIAAQMAMMPMQMLTARLCPRGAEATVFAILAGFQNFGTAIGSIFGVQVAAAFGVSASQDGPCNFDQLGTIVIICHCVSPLLCLPLTWCLVPAASIDDSAAFAMVSPAPSFCSPAASPPLTPVQFPSDPGYASSVTEEYFLFEEDFKRRIS